MDYYCNSVYFVAARLFRSEYKSKFSANRQLDSYTDRHRCHTRHTALAWSFVNSCPTKNWQTDTVLIVRRYLPLLNKQSKEITPVPEKISKKKLKRLPKGQRTHARRLKQAARNDPTTLMVKK